MNSAAPDPAGLASAEVLTRRNSVGTNVLVPMQRSHALRELAAAATDPMALLLAVTAVVYLALGETRNGIVLACALVPVLGVDVLLEARSRRALAALAGAIAPRARVVRDGLEREVPAADLVPGDLLLLQEGDVVAADAVFVRAANLSLDESHLTGESLPQEKIAASDPGPGLDTSKLVPSSGSEAIAGSIVLTGVAAARVLATGARTRFAAIARQVGDAGDARTPLQHRVARIVRPLVAMAAVVALIVFGLALARGEGLGLAFLSAISLAMAAIPEEFPLVLTLFLATGAWRLGRRGVLVRRLAAVETLGSTTVLCVDKTGTLTTGRFGLDEHVSIGGVEDTDLLESSVLACESAPADPLELAIVRHAEEHGVDVAALRARHPMQRDYDFDPVGKHMSHVRGAPGGARIDSKGALEGLLEHCEIGAADREAVLRQESDLASRGMRVLGVARRLLPTFSGGRESDERGLALVGLLAFRDPLRPEVPEAIRQLGEAGIAVKILTGDHALTAASIAVAAGLDAGPGRVLTGADVDRLSPEELAPRVREATVIARLRPEQKNAIILALRSAGEVVAMTGDGINDAPALRQADIGISMGKRATEVARAAADLVLLDDRFSALVETVREGRSIYRNLQQSFLYLIGFHIPILSLALVVPLAGMPLLLLPIHLVWLQLVVHPVSALVFEAEPTDDDLLRIPPRSPTAPLVARGAMVNALLAGTLLSIVVFGAWALRLPAGEEAARSLALATLLIGSLLLVFVERAQGRGLRAAGFPPSMRARFVLVAVAACIPVAIQIRPIAATLSVTPLPWADWALAAALALGAVGWRAFLPVRRPPPSAIAHASRAPAPAISG